MQAEITRLQDTVARLEVRLARYEALHPENS